MNCSPELNVCGKEPTTEDRKTHRHEKDAENCHKVWLERKSKILNQINGLVTLST